MLKFAIIKCKKIDTFFWLVHKYNIVKCIIFNVCKKKFHPLAQKIIAKIVKSMKKLNIQYRKKILKMI